MKILVVTSTFPRWIDDTGPGFVYWLCLKLKEKGHEITVIAPHHGNSRMSENMQGLRIRRFRYFFESWQLLAYSGGILNNIKRNPALAILVPFFLVSQALAIHREVREQNFDLIHAHWIIPQGFLCALLNQYKYGKTVPVLCTSHGSDVNALNNFMLKKLKQWTIMACDHLTIVSNDMKNKCMALGIPEQKLSVISMGVDLKNIFIPVKGTVRNNNRVLYVGRLVEKKGISTLISAISLTHKIHPDIELVIVGDGPQRESLVMQVRNLGLEDNITFLGGIPNEELPVIYSSAAVTVMPSLQEGLGMVIIEALGCGSAVIASALTAIKDIIEHDMTGLLFEPNNSRELADCIQLLLSDREHRDKIAEMGRKFVLDRFDWEIIIRKYLASIHSLTSTGNHQKIQ